MQEEEEGVAGVQTRQTDCTSVVHSVTSGGAAVIVLLLGNLSLDVMQRKHTHVGSEGVCRPPCGPPLPLSRGVCEEWMLVVSRRTHTHRLDSGLWWGRHIRDEQ